MAKKILIISVVFVFISVVLFAWMQIRTLKVQNIENEPSPSDPVSLLGNDPNGINSGPLFTEEAMSIQNEIQQDIQNSVIPSTPYFSTNLQVVDVYPEGLTASQIPYYETLYNPQNNEFQILLFEFPLADTRMRAEKYFLEKLNITQEQACLLKVFVQVTPGASESLAWQNLGLSFCPGSTDLSPYTENVDGVSNADQEQPSDTSL